MLEIYNKVCFLVLIVKTRVSRNSNFLLLVSLQSAMIYEKNRFISDSCLELYFQLHLIENNSFQKIDENFS